MPLERQTRRWKRGNAIIEFALVFPLLSTFLIGLFQLGYAFFLYNELQSAIRAGARYASAADFDQSQSGVTFKSNVQKMVVYGSPTGATALVPGLTTSGVSVTWQVDGTGFPQIITVKISSFPITVLGTTYQLTNKPQATFIYLGQAVT